MEQNERKTKELLGADEILHLYNGDDPHKVYIIGEPRQYENGEGDNKRFVQEFRASYIKPEEGKAPDFRKSGLYRAETKEPFQNLKDFAESGDMLMISGQTFRVQGKNKEGEPMLFNKTFVRSIKTTKVEQRKEGDTVRDVVVGDKDVMPASIACKNEYYAAKTRNLSGFINGVKLNTELKDREGEVFGYRQFMYVGVNGKSTAVEFVTKSPVEEEDFAKGKRISMPGAVRVKERFDKEKGERIKSEVFEPNWIGAFIEKEKAKDKEVGMSEQEIADADSFVPGAYDDDLDGTDIDAGFEDIGL